MFLSAKVGDRIVGQYIAGIIQAVYCGPRGGRYATVLWYSSLRISLKVNLKGNVWSNEKARRKQLHHEVGY